GVEVDPVNGDEVHRDVAHVAGQDNVTAVARDPEVLRRVRAVEGQLVEAGLAVDGVAAVAGVPDERVVPLAADDEVVAGAAGHGQSDHAGDQVRGVHRVVAAEGVDDERVPEPIGVDDVDLGRQPDHVSHGGTGCQADDVDVVVPV